MSALQRGERLSGGPVRAVIFDYGLTLVHFQRPVEAVMAAQATIAQLIEDAGHGRPQASLLAEAVHDRVEREVAAHDASGALEEVDVAALERGAFADIGIELTDELIDRCSVVTQEAWWSGVQPYGDAVEVLTTLRAGGLRTGLCSNAAYRPASMHGQLRHLGLDRLLDAAVFSSEVGWRKPSPVPFQAALRALDATAQESVFVGDRLREDVGGAATAGMRSVLIARGQGPTTAGDARPTAVVRSLGELVPLLLDG